MGLSGRVCCLPRLLFFLQENSLCSNIKSNNECSLKDITKISIVIHLTLSLFLSQDMVLGGNTEFWQLTFFLRRVIPYSGFSKITLFCYCCLLVSPQVSCPCYFICLTEFSYSYSGCSSLLKTREVSIQNYRVSQKSAPV